MANGYQFFYPQQTASPAPPALSAKRSRGSRRSRAAACWRSARSRTSGASCSPPSRRSAPGPMAACHGNATAEEALRPGEICEDVGKWWLGWFCQWCFLKKTAQFTKRSSQKMRQWWIPSAKIWVWWCKIGWCQNTVITCNYKWLGALSMQNIPWSNRFISNQDNQVQSLWSWMILSSQFMIRFLLLFFPTDQVSSAAVHFPRLNDQKAGPCCDVSCATACCVTFVLLLKLKKWFVGQWG